jgi:hypothetical protein
VIVVDDAGLSSLEPIIEELPVLEYVVLLGPGRPEGTVGPARPVNVAEVLVLARPDLALRDEPAALRAT